MKKKFSCRVLAALLATLFVLPLLLCAPAASAEGENEAFLAAVAAISDAVNLAERAEAVEYAQSLAPAADDSLPAVAEAKQKLAVLVAEITAAVDACENYITYAYAALDAYEKVDPYTEIRGAINSAHALDSKIDESYPGVSAAKSTLRSVESAVMEIEDQCNAYLASTERFLNAATYEAMSVALAAYEKSEQILATVVVNAYPGVAEAKAAAENKRAEMSEVLAQATVFVAAVNAIGRGENLSADIQEAIGIREVTDLTVPDAAFASETLDGYIARYNAAAAWANAEFEGWLLRLIAS